MKQIYPYLFHKYKDIFYLLAFCRQMVGSGIQINRLARHELYLIALWLSACWYRRALTLWTPNVLAKLCVPEKSSLAHMYKY